MTYSTSELVRQERLIDGLVGSLNRLSLAEPAEMGILSEVVLNTLVPLLSIWK